MSATGDTRLQLPALIEPKPKDQLIQEGEALMEALEQEKRTMAIIKMLARMKRRES